jgi:hypothetical protein
LQFSPLDIDKWPMAGKRTVGQICSGRATTHPIESKKLAQGAGKDRECACFVYSVAGDRTETDGRSACNQENPLVYVHHLTWMLVRALHGILDYNLVAPKMPDTLIWEFPNH